MWYFISANTIETKNDEFWDYDKQIDLEAFSSRTLYDTLSKQSRAVTNTIGKHKDEVRNYFNIQRKRKNTIYPLLTVYISRAPYPINRIPFYYLQTKQMYNRIANQTESLKGLWAAKMNLKGKASMATDEDLVSYENKLEALEIELERRRDVGRRFEAILNKQKELMVEDEHGREKHQVSCFLIGP
jgi:hypothetical protein